MTTIDDIATQAGVSPKTVSNVLSGRLRATRRDAVARAERIRRVAAELNYRPNAAARAMSTGRFNAVAMLHGANVGKRFMPERLAAGLHEAAHQHGQHLLSATLPDSSLTDEEAMPAILQQLAVDGLLIDYIHDAPAGMIDLIHTHQLPAIWINHKRDHDCVYPDEVWPGRTMVQELAKLGHRKIAYVSRRNDAHYSVSDRETGYRHAMRDAGLTPRILPMRKSLPEDELAGEWARLLATGDLPTAIVCYGQSEAASLVYAAARAGISVPEQVSVACVAANFVTSPGISIAAARQFFSEVGRVALARLMRKIEDPAMDLDPVAIEGTWHPGATVAPPASE